MRTDTVDSLGAWKVEKPGSIAANVLFEPERASTSVRQHLKPRCAGEAREPIIERTRFADKPRDGIGDGDALEDPEKPGAKTSALPLVGNDDRDLRGVRVVARAVPRFADDALAALRLRHPNKRYMCAMIDVN